MSSVGTTESVLFSLVRKCQIKAVIEGDQCGSRTEEGIRDRRSYSGNETRRGRCTNADRGEEEEC